MQVKNVCRKLACLAVLLNINISGTSVANAAVITFANRTSFDATFPGSILENWDGFANGTVFPDGTTTNGITYNSSAGNALVTNTFLVSSSPNGLGDTTVGFFQASDSIVFGFSSALRAFGIDINTFSTAFGAYTATTSNGDAVSSVFNPFPGFQTGQFVGFSSSNPFNTVTISAGLGGQVFTLDSLRGVRSNATVPEPSILMLTAIGLFGLLLARRRKHASFYS